MKKISAAEYDVFISHSSRIDLRFRDLVDALATGLESHGLKTFLDRKIFYGGQPLFPALENAISNSTVGLLVVTKRALRSSFVKLECDTMHRYEQSGKMKKLVLNLDNSPLPHGCSATVIVPTTLNDPTTLANQVAAAVRLVSTRKRKRHP